jgi:hypothetical protein
MMSGFAARKAKGKSRIIAIPAPGAGFTGPYNVFLEQIETSQEIVAEGPLPAIPR